MYDYSPLWQTMREMGITTYRLIKEGIDKKTLSNLQHNNRPQALPAAHCIQKKCHGTDPGKAVYHIELFRGECCQNRAGRKRRGSLVLSFFFTFLELQKIRNITF